MNNTSDMVLWVYANSGAQNGNGLQDSGLTVGGYAAVNPGKYGIKNWIRERGYKSAWLNISTKGSTVSGYLSGLWSPDMAGSYPSAN